MLLSYFVCSLKTWLTKLPFPLKQIFIFSLFCSSISKKRNFPCSKFSELFSFCKIGIASLLTTPTIPKLIPTNNVIIIIIICIFQNT